VCVGGSSSVEPWLAKCRRNCCPAVIEPQGLAVGQEHASPRELPPTGRPLEHRWQTGQEFSLRRTHISAHRSGWVRKAGRVKDCRDGLRRTQDRCGKRCRTVSRIEQAKSVLCGPPRFHPCIGAVCKQSL